MSSTHAIGPVRLLLGSLLLLLVGAGLYWMLWGRMTGNEALVIRGGPIEIEPWAGTLRSEGSGLVWDYEVAHVLVSIYRSESDDQEFELAEPITVPGVKSIRVALRVGGIRTVDQAVVLSLEERAVKLSMKEGQLTRKGDVWVHPGFLQDGRKKRFEIASLEFLDRGNQVIARYQNPDLGRRLRFRVKLVAASGGGG